MKHLFLSLFAVFFAVALPPQDAQAKRFGGGKSSGFQRDNIGQRQVTPKRNADAPPAQPNPAGAPAGQAGKRSWMGPVAGLAAGLGLAALASHLGLGEEFANLLLIALLVMGGLFLFKWLARKRTQPQTGMQYAGAGHAPVHIPAPSAPLTGNVSAIAQPAANDLPAGFDEAAFTRQAKLNFLRLQAAYDAGNLDDLREFTSPEMFAEIKLQLGERGEVSQQTDVLNLDAQVLEALEEGGRYIVSVRFSGLIREEQGAPATDFQEIWHLTRPAQGKQGWVVAGIQQAG
ncbi:MAG TPA: Tim44-like domain-containing protein [Thiobacillaceae bacterium]|nr:Tim44-like domain-containing protein [Thiobacillaceae bacterium]HNU65247.1 Tim44-like domain-containing protein [Thiobacillaceae bacterium]